MTLRMGSDGEAARSAEGSLGMGYGWVWGPEGAVAGWGARQARDFRHRECNKQKAALQRDVAELERRQQAAAEEHEREAQKLVAELEGLRAELRRAQQATPAPERLPRALSCISPEEDKARAGRKSWREEMSEATKRRRAERAKDRADQEKSEQVAAAEAREEAALAAKKAAEATAAEVTTARAADAQAAKDAASAAQRAHVAAQRHLTIELKREAAQTAAAANRRAAEEKQALRQATERDRLAREQIFAEQHEAEIAAKDEELERIEQEVCRCPPLRPPTPTRWVCRRVRLAHRQPRLPSPSTHPPCVSLAPTPTAAEMRALLALRARCSARRRWLRRRSRLRSTRRAWPSMRRAWRRRACERRSCSSRTPSC